MTATTATRVYSGEENRDQEVVTKLLMIFYSIKKLI